MITLSKSHGNTKYLSSEEKLICDQIIGGCNEITLSADKRCLGHRVTVVCVQGGGVAITCFWEITDDVKKNIFKNGNIWNLMQLVCRLILSPLI